MLEKFKISLLVWVGFLPTYTFYKFCLQLSYEGMYHSLFYLCLILFGFFMAIFGKHKDKTKFTTYLYSSAAIFFILLNLVIFLYFNYQHNSKDLFVVENEHHQMKFKKSGRCVVREMCCHEDKQSYFYGDYEIMADTILLDGKVFNRKNFKTFAIKGKRVRLISKDEKRNDYYTFEIIEDNRTIKP